MSIGFKLHCSSDIESRLTATDVVTETATNVDTEEFIEEVQQSSTIRALVLEVTRPIHGTKRIVNTDNFYTSVTAAGGFTSERPIWTRYMSRK